MEEIRKESGRKESDADEEFAAEFAGSVPRLNVGLPGTGERRVEGLRAPDRKEHAERTERAVAPNRTIGWIAMIVALASLFYWPAVLGPVGAVLGFIALIRGNRALGLWSIALGLLSLVAFLFLVPYYS